MSQNEPRSILSALVQPSDYLESRKKLFPSPSSLEWYTRQHRERLADAGALLMHCGRWYIHPDKFDACVVEIAAAGTKPGQAVA